MRAIFSFNITSAAGVFVAAVCCLSAISTQAARFVYFDQASYLSDLTALGFTPVQESFEDDAAWGSVRSTVLNPKTLPAVTSLGMTWQNRFFPVGNITTNDGGGFVHDGTWQFYALPHGGYGITGLDCNVPGVCSDGFKITSEGAGTLYGVGGWFTGASGPEIKFALDGNIVIDAGGTGNNIWQFFGVIDTAGFSMAEIFDSSGTLDDQNLLWADDFTFATATAVPAPLQSYLIITGQQIAGNLASLSASDDDYLRLMSATAGNRAISSTLYIAGSPATAVSSLNVTLELGSDNVGVIAIFLMYDFDSAAWNLINGRLLPLADTVITLPDITSPNAYVRNSDGQIRLLQLTLANTASVPAGYTTRVDQVQFEVKP